MSMSLVKYVIAQNKIRKKCEGMSPSQVKEVILLLEHDLAERKKKKNK